MNKKNFSGGITFALVVSLSILMFSLASCEEKEPDLTKKEMDTRLLGTWKSINSNNPEINKLIFMSNGDIIGYWKMGGEKRVFYTENNCHLFVFVQGLGIKLSNWTYEHYYEIDGNKLTLWSSWDKDSSDCYIFQKEK